ncbi:MAG: hypothetical protein MPN21_13465 [Thermoanaerobaculia bacterium]|nr:hypothetical protein [Thermoanaerobaculia bacterium]
MNAYCSSYDDDSIFHGSDEVGGTGNRSDSSRDNPDSSLVEPIEAFDLTALGVTGESKESDLDGYDLAYADEYDWYFEERDTVERYAMRKVAVATTLDLVAEHLEGEPSRNLSALEAASPLIWVATQLPASTLHLLAEEIRSRELEDPTIALAAWRGGVLQRTELRQVARALLDAGRAEQIRRDGDDRVVEGPWRRRSPILQRIHQLHVLLLAIRHSDLELDETDERIVGLRLEELGSDLGALAREIRTGAIGGSGSEEQFSETAMLVASAGEMWRDTAPAAHAVRFPLEQLTRLTWHVARRREVARAERAMLLIAADNQRLDDLPMKEIESGLHTALSAGEDESAGPGGRGLSATWVGGRQPELEPAVPGLNLETEALVIRALSGPARTGPRRG